MKSSFASPNGNPGPKAPTKRKVARRRAPEPEATEEPTATEEPEATDEPAAAAPKRKVAKRKTAKRKVARKKAAPEIEYGDTVEFPHDDYEEPIEGVIIDIHKEDCTVLFLDEDENGNEQDTELVLPISGVKFISKGKADLKAEPEPDPVDAEVEVVEEKPAPKKKKAQPPAKREETAMVPRDEDAPVTRFNPTRVGETAGELATLDKRPSLAIAHNVGDLKQDHKWTPGDFVLGTVYGLSRYKADYQPITLVMLAYGLEYVEDKKFNKKGDMPKIFMTAAEVRNAGGTTDWINGQGGERIPPTYRKQISCAVAIKEPEYITNQNDEQIDCELFSHEYKKEKWAVAHFKLARTGFDYCINKEFMNIAPRKNPHHHLLTVEIVEWRRPGGENDVFVPNITRVDAKKKNSPEFIEFLEGLI